MNTVRNLNRRRWSSMVAVGAIALGLAACSTETSTGSDADDSASTGECSMADKRMVYVSVLRENPVLQIMAQGAIDGAEDAGFGESEWLAPQGFDEAATVQLANQAIAQGIDGMVVFATSPAFYPMIAKAQAAGIPVIQTHSQIPEGDAPGVVANVYPDPVKMGEAAAEAIGNEVGGEGAVAVTQTAFIPNENAIVAAFNAKIEADFPNMRLIPPAEVGGDQAKAIAAESAIIQANPDVVAAFGTYGNAPVTWATTQQETGRDLTVIGMDYAQANLDNVRDGKVFGVVAQPLYEEHFEGAQLLKQVLCGEDVTYDNPLDAPIVTLDNVDEYYTLLKKVNIN
jgi:ribose transport system substrate-binding protein